MEFSELPFLRANVSRRTLPYESIKQDPTTDLFRNTLKADIKMAEESTFFNEENMKVIRNILKEEFAKKRKEHSEFDQCKL